MDEVIDKLLFEEVTLKTFLVLDFKFIFYKRHYKLWTGSYNLGNDLVTIVFFLQTAVWNYNRKQQWHVV